MLFNNIFLYDALIIIHLTITSMSPDILFSSPLFLSSVLNLDSESTVFRYGSNTREKSRYGSFGGELTRAMGRTSIRDRFYTMAIRFRDIVSIFQSRMQQSHSIDALARAPLPRKHNREPSEVEQLNQREASVGFTSAKTTLNVESPQFTNHVRMWLE